ncbi:aminotransferase class I/II-fold pyridoxal phosphate-dependent enzyme [Leptospira sp. GIMC2001]|uniref:aminotransferase class I/II-fold pyridoxal phosphate-dependent enzyme n=1 Tax=Leptospira sp. GIMC2001 TaxID=1513297 RepID=UPI0023492A7E|nr:aminotransferase class I/II-fold pyridoxal phosphate-dependent enzyme [Leptospira sp. GIMC2001]WCL49887.1 aminotransferase class I/II-fold pyridoxal phosphate-dependent enzyme [Leptospira sp. GIMC2001]
MVPEYIGYADQTIHSGNIVSLPPLVDLHGTNRFRYLPDMNRIEARINKGDIGAVCLSRPTNPSGNVISWTDIESIYEMAQDKNIPFLIDNAYGFPFPNILFTEPTIRWRPGMVHVLSLSKLGLPGARTGIVVASKEIISVISEISAVMNLANGNLGPAMIEDLIRDGSIYKMSTNIIKPFYQKQSKEVIDMIDTIFKPNIEYRIHESLGALFLWIWFPNLKMSSREIYREAKARGVFIIDGENFFPGLEEEFSHQKQCIRLTYSRTLSEVKRGIEILQNVLT